MRLSLYSVLGGRLERPPLTGRDFKTGSGKGLGSDNPPLYSSDTVNSGQEASAKDAPSASPFAIRFWAKVDRSAGPDGCWPWTAGCDNNGYGQVRVGVRIIRAARVALELATGRPLGKRWALHRCDNPPCVNPAHLFPGSARKNAQDCARKGRNGMSKRTHCPRGHKYTTENTRYTRKTSGRRCQTCERKACRERRAS